MHKRNQSPRSPLIRALEPRILFDAAVVDAAADTATDQTVAADGSTPAVHPPDSVLPSGQSPIARALANARAQGEQARSAVFVDGSVEGRNALTEAANRQSGAEIYVVHSGEDGLARMAEVLDGGDYEAAHIVGHGDSAEVDLGETRLSSDSLDARSGELSAVGEALGPDGDLLLYGCSVADGPAGRAFVNELSGLAGGVDVAASTTATGSADHGGDWALEYSTGAIDTTTLSAPGYDGLLAPPEVDAPDKDFSVAEDEPLTINEVSVSDADGDDLDVTLSVGEGFINLASNSLGNVSGDGTGSVTITGASASDINAALDGMTYQGSANYNGSDTLKVTADDGDSTTRETVGIQISPVNDPPELNPSQTLSVDEGGTGTFGEANFGLEDPDLDTGDNTLAQEVFEIKGLPGSGTLKLDGNLVDTGSTFSAEQIGDLVYEHDGSNVAAGDTDSFKVRVNDGGDVSGVKSINVDLQPVNQPPQLTGRNPDVFEGQGEESNGDGTEGVSLGLGYSDPEKGTADIPGEVDVAVDNIDMNGKGTLYLDTDGNGKLDSGEEVANGDRFTADQLDDLRFNHNGTEPDGTNPTFDVTLTDNGGGEGAGNELSVTDTVSIDVKPNNDDPILETNAGVNVNAGDTVVLTPSDLKTTDADNDPGDLTYVVNSKPAHGDLQVRDSSGNWKTLGAGERAQFTQEDIANGNVRFRQNGQVPSGTTNDSFDFEVYDGELKAFNKAGDPGAVRDNNGDIATNTFDLTINGENTDGQGPGTPDDDYDGSLNLTEETNEGFPAGGANTPAEGDGEPGSDEPNGVDDTSTITQSDLEYRITSSQGGIDYLPDQVRYRLNSVPDNGRLQLSSDGGNTWKTLSAYDSFTQADINDGNLRFVHDGSETHQGDFEFSVAGGGAKARSGTFEISVTPTNDRPDASGSSDNVVREGGTIRLDGDAIGLSDADTANEDGEPIGEASEDDLYFRATSLPEHGDLQRWDGSDWVNIDTDDLISKSLLSETIGGETSGIRYRHSGGDQQQELSDTFEFTVRDDLSKGNDAATDVKSYSGVGGAPDDSGLALYEGRLSEPATVDLTVIPINDAPIIPQNPGDPDITITNNDGVDETSANDELNLAEGETREIGNDLLNVVDPDTPTDVRQYRITNGVEHGTLKLDGKTLGVGSRFTQADIDSGKLEYTHDGSEEFADGFDFIVSDSVSDHYYETGENGNPPGASRFDINVDTARNDTPTIDNDGDETVDLFGDGFGSNFTHDFGDDLTIMDADLEDGVDTGAGETDFIQVELVFRDGNGDPVDVTANGGGINLGSQGGLTITDNDASDGKMAFQGSYADVKAAINGLSVTVPNTDANDTYSLDVSVDDRLRDGNGVLEDGANGDDDPGTLPENEDGSPINANNNVDTTSVTFRVSDDNDPPTFTATPGDQTVDEDTVLDLSGYQIDDPDAFDSDLSIDLAVNNGHLSVNGDATTSDSDSLTLTGTVDELNAQLANLTYIGNQDFHSSDGNNDNNADDSLSITVNDGGHYGSGGSNEITDSTDIAIKPVNDAPTVDTPGTQVLENQGDDSVTFAAANGNAITIGDARDYDNNQPVNDDLRLTVEVTDGTGELTAATTNGLNVTRDGSNGTLELEGKLSDLQAALDGLRYKPDGNNVDQTDTLEVTLNDKANGGEALTDGVGGAKKASATVDVQISGTNDGPSVDAPPTLTATEDATLTLSGSKAFKVSDPDHFDKDMEITVSVDYGTLTASASGVTVTNDNSGQITLVGSQSALNDALDGLEYTPTPDFHTEDVTGDEITVGIDDLGNTGTGGAKTAEQSATINVDPVNDPPTESGDPDPLDPVTEDTDGGTGRTLEDLLKDNYADAADDQTGNSGGDTSTDLNRIAIVGSTDYTSAQGVWQISDGSGGWIDVPTSGLDDNNALIFDKSRDVRFNPADDFFGTPGTLDVRVSDSDALPDSPTIDDTSGSSSEQYDLGSDTNGGLGADNGRWSDTVTIESTVDGVNDRPTGADGTLSSINEGDLDPDGAIVADLFGDDYSDDLDDQADIRGGGDASGTFGGIAIVGNAAQADQGTWQYSTDGGSNWADLDTNPGDSNATTLAESDRLRFVPVNNDYNDNSDSNAGAPGDLSVRLADTPQSANSGEDITGKLTGTSSYSAVKTLSTSVKPVNDQPSATPSKDFDVPEDVGMKTESSFMTDIRPDSNVVGNATDEAGQEVSFTIKDVGDGSDFTASELFDTLPEFVDSAGSDNSIRFDPSDILAEGETQTVQVAVGVKDDGGTANGGEDTGDDQTFTITIQGSNDAPLSTDDLPDQSDADGDPVTTVDTSGQFNDSDHNDTLSYDASNLPSGLGIDSGTGKITGTLDSDASQGGANGDGEYSVTITATDDEGATATSEFEWTVTNPGPEAANDTDSTDQDTITSGDVIAGAGNGDGQDTDGDNDSDELKVDQVSVGGTDTPVSDGKPAIVEGDNGGQFAINSDGNYEFDPAGDFDDLTVNESRDTRIEYQVSDDQGGTDTATLTVTVDGRNDPPTSTDDLPDREHRDGDSIPVIDTRGQFDDPDSNDTLSYDADNLPPGLSIDANTGKITGTLDFDASQGGASGDGEYSVTITARDSEGATATSDFTWTVTNPPPEATDDARTTDQNTSTSGDVLANDTDTANDNDPLTVSGINGAAGDVGSVVMGDNGGEFTINSDGNYTFDPAGDFDDLVSSADTRETTVDYTVSDGEGGTDTATLTVEVTGENDAPEVDDTLIGDQKDRDGDTVSVDVSGAFSDVDGDDVTFSAGNLPPGLSIDSSTGEISGQLDADASQSGPYTVEITADDGNGGTVIGTFEWQVDNPPPQASDDTNATDPDTSTSGDVLVNDTDTASDSDPPTVGEIDGASGDVGSVVTGDNGGQFTINADGSYRFDPNDDFDDLAPGKTRETTVQYTVSDGNGGTDTATLTITITADIPAVIPPDPGLPEGGEPSTPGEDFLEGIGDGGIPGVSIDLGLPPLWRTDSLFPGIESGVDDGLEARTSLRYQATRSDGSPLPKGLTVDPDTGEIKGRLPQDMERAELRVIGVDEKGNTQTHEVVVDRDGNIVDGKDESGPEARSGYHRMEVSVGADGQVTIESGRDSDIAMSTDRIRVDGRSVDIGVVDSRSSEVTRYVGRLANGEPLPQGLAVDADTGWVAGRLPQNARDLSIQVIAEHPEGENRTLQIDLELSEASADSGGWRSFDRQIRSALAATGDAVEASHGNRLVAALGGHI